MSGRKVAIDPIAVYRKLNSYPGLDLEADLVRCSLAATVTDGSVKVDYESLDRLIQATRSAFGIEEFNEDEGGEQHGMLDVEIEDLLMSFLEYMSSILKKKNLTPTSQEPTGSAADPTTKPTLASG